MRNCDHRRPDDRSAVILATSPTKEGLSQIEGSNKAIQAHMHPRSSSEPQGHCLQPPDVLVEHCSTPDLRGKRGRREQRAFAARRSRRGWFQSWPDCATIDPANRPLPSRVRVATSSESVRVGSGTGFLNQAPHGCHQTTVAAVSDCSARSSSMGDDASRQRGPNGAATFLE